MERSCTDVWMCIIFFLFFVGMFATAIYGYIHGDPSKLITPFDSDGNQCGTGELSEFKYIWWPNPVSSINSAACVVECPQEDDLSNCFENSKIEECPISTNNSTLYLERFCLPDGMSDVILENFLSDGLTKYMGDMVICWWVFLVMSLIILVLCIIYLILLRCFAKPMIYISFTLILVLLVGGGAYVFSQSKNYEDGDNTKSVMKWMGILLWIIACIYLVILLCCCGRIRMGIAIMEATSNFVRDTMSIFFVPIIFFAFIIVWIFYWVISAVYVYSVGEVKGLG